MLLFFASAIHKGCFRLPLSVLSARSPLIRAAEKRSAAKVGQRAVRRCVAFHSPRDHAQKASARGEETSHTSFAGSKG